MTRDDLGGYGLLESALAGFREAGPALGKASPATPCTVAMP